MPSMNYNNSSTQRTTSSRRRHQEQQYNVDPLNTVDGEDDFAHENSYDRNSAIADSNRSDQQEHHYHSDLFEPLTYEEADENQLAEFFMTLDIDAAFGECDNVINNLPKDSGKQSTKRRRLSNSSDSYASSFSHDVDDFDDATRLQRKHRTSSK